MKINDKVIIREAAAEIGEVTIKLATIIAERTTTTEDCTLHEVLVQWGGGDSTRVRWIDTSKNPRDIEDGVTVWHKSQLLDAAQLINPQT